MRYKLTQKLEPVFPGEKLPEGCAYLETLTRQECEVNYPDPEADRALLRGISHAHCCKADMLEHCVAGTFLIPFKEGLPKKEAAFSYYLDQNRLIFIDDTGTVEKMLSEMKPVLLLEKDGAPHFFFEFLEFLIRDDVMFLQKYEKRLDDLEDCLLERDVKDFENKLHFYRRSLLKLSTYYSQLDDLGDTLSENWNGLFSEADCRAFGLFSNRASRLYEHTRTLREYSLQLHEIYQSKMDVRQNRIMQFLTVVTTIFLPLTLIAGWYGMNFSAMPELRAPWAYPLVIVLSILIVLGEIIYFKRKNWFK